MTTSLSSRVVATWNIGLKAGLGRMADGLFLCGVHVDRIQHGQ